MKCQNCKREISDTYCPTCGQKAKTNRITLTKFIQDVAHGLSNTQDGLLHTIKELTMRPGPFIRDYIAGKRIAKNNPFQYLILMTALLLLSDQYIGVPGEFVGDPELVHTDFYQLGIQIGKFSKTWIKWLWLLSPLSLALWNLLFYRAYNLAEHLIVATYAIAHGALILSLITWCYQVNFVFDYLYHLIVIIICVQVYQPFRSLMERILISIISAVGGAALYVIFVGVIYYIYSTIMG